VSAQLTNFILLHAYTHFTAARAQVKIYIAYFTNWHNSTFD